MRRAGLFALLLGLGVSVSAQAGAPYSRSPWGLWTGGAPTASPSFTGTVSSSGGYLAIGSCSSVIGDVACFDNNGVVGGQRTTDAAPQGLLLRPQPAYAGGTQTASILTLIGGQDETTCAIDGADPSVSCAGDNDFITVTVLDSNGTSTATTLTEGTAWTATASVADTCASLAAAVDALAGVGATCTSPNVLFTLDPNTASLSLSESTAACTTVSIGTHGKVLLNPNGNATCLGNSSTSPCFITSGTTNINISTFGGASWGGALYLNANSADTVPTLAAGSDQNTGVNWPGGDELRLVAGGNQITRVTATSLIVRPTAANSGVMQVGTAGSNFFQIDTTNSAMSFNAASSLRLGHVYFCGLGPNATTATYMSPNLSLMWGGASAGAATACSAGANTTEATADLPMFPYLIYPVAMTCGMQDVAADSTGVTFTLRAATADVGTDMSCVTGALDAAGVNGCNDQRTAGAARYSIAANAAIAMSAVATTGNESTSNMFCDLTYSY